MIDEDFGTFDRAFRRLSGAFRIKLKPVALDELAKIYFKAFEGARLGDVLTAGRTCLAECRKFPTVAEWLDALPKVAQTGVENDVRVMVADEVFEYHRAMRLHYEDEPCTCLMCQAAHITGKPLRFVPNELPEISAFEYAHDLERKRVVIAGHWAHGEELVRWYGARAHFMNLGAKTQPKVLALMRLPPREREPGEDDE